MIHLAPGSVFTASVKWAAAMLTATLPYVVVAALSTTPIPRPPVTAPSPALDPSDVVRIQVEALRTNNLKNEGIELTFNFASPANRRVTGPLPRFIEMLRSAPYDRLLNHLNASYSQAVVSDNRAHQLVTITDMVGEEITYQWVLTRQTEGEFKDCWMTNAVIPAPAQPTDREAM